MLKIVVYVDRKVVAQADVARVEEDGILNLSDYLVSATNEANPLTGADKRLESGLLRNHNRKQSVWALVHRVAQFLKDKDLERDTYLLQKKHGLD